MNLCSSVKIQPMSARRIRVTLDSGYNLEACGLESEREASAAGKQIEDPGFRTRMESCDLLPNSLNHTASNAIDCDNR